MLRYLFIASAVLLLAAPTLAEEETRWVCGEEAGCVESTEPNFARKTCEERRVCAEGTCVEFCATGSERRAIEGPGGDGPTWWPWNHPEFSNTPIFIAHPDSTETVSDAFDSLLVGVLATQSLQGRHVGRGDGVIAFDDGKRSYRFSRTIDVDRGGLVSVAYRIEDHPTYSRLTVESPSRGVDVFVTVEYRDGSNRFEIFNFSE